jgi:ribose transport system permease protein
MSRTSVDERPPPGSAQGRARSLRLQEYALVFVILGLVVLGAVIRPGVFLTYNNVLTILTAASVVGVIAVGMTYVIATGGIDLSVGSMTAAAAIAGGLAAESGVFGETGGSIAFMITAIAFALLLGLVNALSITWGRVVPFIATLAMFTAARGIALRLSDQQPISIAGLDTLRFIGTGDVLGIPVTVLVFLSVVAAGWYGLNRTAYGRYVVATGGNPEAARIAGIRVQRIRFSVYLLSALCVGISAILLTGRLASASPVVGNLYELDAIAAVVIGGTSLSGGKATVIGTFLGVITFALIFNILNLLGLPAELQQIVRGVIILVAVIAQRRQN